MKPLSEVAPDLLVIQILIQAVCSITLSKVVSLKLTLHSAWIWN